MVMFCKHCGAKLDDDARFCEGCGAAVDSSAQAYAPGSAQAYAAPVQPSQNPRLIPAREYFCIICFTFPSGNSTIKETS